MVSLHPYLYAGVLASFLLSFPAYADTKIHQPLIAPFSGDASKHYLEFSARYGPGSVTGHLNIRTYAVKRNGSRKLTSLFGFYARGGKAEYIASLIGTPGKVGYTWLDLKIRPIVRYRVLISRTSHRRILRAAARLYRSERWFQLFEANCNYLAARIAKMIGLRAPGNFGIYPDDFLRRLRALNTKSNR